MALGLSLATSLLALVAGAIGGRKQNDSWTQIGERSLYISFVLITIAIGILVYSLVTGNFWLRYVYGYSNNEMPMIYKITALWGGQEGSLLFWLWLTSFFGAASIFTHRTSDRPLIPYATAVFGFILAFFSFLLI